MGAHASNNHSLHMGRMQNYVNCASRSRMVPKGPAGPQGPLRIPGSLQGFLGAPV